MCRKNFLTYVLLICCGFISFSVHSETIWVDKDTDWSGCGCSETDTCCSFRNAITLAQPNDRISFDESELPENTVTVSEGEIVIDKNITIDGDLDDNGDSGCYDQV